MRNLTLALLMFLALSSGCGGGGGGDALALHSTPQGFQSVQDFLNHPVVLQLLARGNLTVHTGSNPPNIEGRYDVTETIQINDLAPGSVGLSGPSDLTFFDQLSDLISVADPSTTVANVFITGSGIDFTIWIVFSERLPGFDCTVVEVNIMTGRALPNGNLDMRIGAVLVGLFGTDCAALLGDPDALLGSVIVASLDAKFIGPLP